MDRITRFFLSTKTKVIPYDYQESKTDLNFRSINSVFPEKPGGKRPKVVFV